MLDIRNLERRWLKYKIKSYAPYIIGVSIILLLLAMLPYIWFDSEKPVSSLKTSPLSSETPVKVPEMKSRTEAASNIIEPSMDFVQTFQPSVPEAHVTPVAIPQSTKPIPQAVPVPKVLHLPESPSIKTPPPVISPLSDNKALSMNRNESKLDIDSVERRFKETSNPNLGLFVARYHYDHGNYNEAYNFALKTNSINNKMDESWVIFSKSLVKLGKTEQAKKTLQAYISDSNSESARALLDSIERGSFK